MRDERQMLQQELVELERRLDELSQRATTSEQQQELVALRQRLEHVREQLLRPATAMDRVKLARHPDRPHTLDFIAALFEDFVEIHGDRRFGDDPAIVCGLARFHGEPVLVVGHEKGRDLRERQYRNFGMPKPEGYRKALRAMKLAEKFRRPIFSFVDTPGAYPGVDAEERGQAEAIAYNLREMARLRVPIIVTITGEGGSGGALAIAVGDVVLMLENAIYSVISPEGCAAILWRDAGKADRAAEALKLTAPDLLELGVIDRIVPEPVGGAHANPQRMAEILDQSLRDALAQVREMTPEELVARRYEKFRTMGHYVELSEEQQRALLGEGQTPRGPQPIG